MLITDMHRLSVDDGANNGRNLSTRDSPKIVPKINGGRPFGHHKSSRLGNKIFTAKHICFSTFFDPDDLASKKEKRGAFGTPLFFPFFKSLKIGMVPPPALNILDAPLSSLHERIFHPMMKNLLCNSG